ncbi:hypothetical protein FEM48_Zijuj05G0061300 [Ziziphus jujuba var. spinosa]|uniref:Uncharacterized protein n=1 Tax=Ziziphus jujuba var. spinosa TaxID=714518 RepID=A0A978VD92_ZIZJJ|nr:hypothetical protein FEM48_Zijuj05G0061300 [Ziziphus jujuba var. spinosa]
MDSFYDKVIVDHLDPNGPKTELRRNHDVVNVLLQVSKNPNQAVALSNDQIKVVLTLPSGVESEGLEMEASGLIMHEKVPLCLSATVFITI